MTAPRSMVTARDPEHQALVMLIDLKKKGNKKNIKITCCLARLGVKGPFLGQRGSGFKPSVGRDIGLYSPCPWRSRVLRNSYLLRSTSASSAGCAAAPHGVQGRYLLSSDRRQMAGTGRQAPQTSKSHPQRAFLPTERKSRPPFELQNPHFSPPSSQSGCLPDLPDPCLLHAFGLSICLCVCVCLCVSVCSLCLPTVLPMYVPYLPTSFRPHLALT